MLHYKPHTFQATERRGLTCESLNVSEQDGDLLVSVDVDLVELERLEIAAGLFLLQRDVPDHLLRHEARQHRQKKPLLPLVLLLRLEPHLEGTPEMRANGLHQFEV